MVVGGWVVIGFFSSRPDQTLSGIIEVTVGERTVRKIVWHRTNKSNAEKLSGGSQPYAALCGRRDGWGDGNETKGARENQWYRKLDTGKFWANISEYRREIYSPLQLLMLKLLYFRYENAKSQKRGHYVKD